MIWGFLIFRDNDALFEARKALERAYFFTTVKSFLHLGRQLIQRRIRTWFLRSRYEKIECIIRSEKLKDFTSALKKTGVGGMTVSEVRGFGVQSDRPDTFLFVQKTKIEIYALDSQVKDIISCVLMYCSTGKAGDGKIAVYAMDDFVRISSGERKRNALLKGRKTKGLNLSIYASLIAGALICGMGLAYATPSTLIWSPSTDIQPYKKIHVTSDFYFPIESKDDNGNRTYVGQVYGLTFSLLPDDPENNPLGEIMAETGFDYKKGYGPSLDTYPWCFHFKLGVPEDAYFTGMPAFAFGSYDMGIKRNKTDNDVWYFRSAKTINIGKNNLGRLSAGFFYGNDRLLLDQNGLSDNKGPMFAWERTMSEISDKLWLCVDYQGTQSSYGALNVGFSYKIADNISAILGFDFYNNRDLSDTVTLQLDVDL